jgi:threonine synthase
MRKACDNILEAIGNTPLVRLNRLAADLAPAVYAKVEMVNPGGSVKDRIAVAMVDEAERSGLLKPGEPSSRPRPVTPVWGWPWWRRFAAIAVFSSCRTR